MDSLRNSDILAVIEARVPDRLAEIEKERNKALEEIRKLEEEQSKLFAIQDATNGTTVLPTFAGHPPIRITPCKASA
jgi:hypothetical protein